MSDTISFSLNGQTVEAKAGETIWQVATRLGVEIPHLCYSPEADYRADGNCRACMVEIEGERVLAASCIRMPSDGMVVNSASDRARTARKMVFEMLTADQPERETSHDPESKFWNWASDIGVEGSRLPQSSAPEVDQSHTAMRVNLDACIHCNLCVRACREVQVNDVIGMAYRGHGAKIVFDFDDPMGESTCVACGECIQACPTGALMESSLLDEKQIRVNYPDEQVESVCPYCGVGCQIAYNLKDGKLLFVDGKEGPANRNRLCVKGRFGFDYVHHEHRLTVPLIRKEGVPKDAHEDVDPANPFTHFRKATWEEALDRAADGIRRIREEHGPKGLAGFGSAKGSNEEAYLVQKLVRTGFGTNNVDHCTRLCHASSVAALMECIGSGAVTAPFTACEDAEVMMVIGANPTENHPVAATFFKQQAKAGKTLIVCDPRGQALRKHATHMLQFKPGTDVAMLNAMLHVIVEEGLHDEQFVQARTDGFEALREHLKDYAPEKMAEICGIDAEKLRTVARTYATSNA
ncbi:MAG: molybdopterin-dependent oxidoreductase, partial [Pseudomonadota bacterium]|nr:molybdopterin-dependent oxidoreductase [Pseudomonadota bacterium]